jgi:hypothetical protein
MKLHGRIAQNFVSNNHILSVKLHFNNEMRLSYDADKKDLRLHDLFRLATQTKIIRREHGLEKQNAHTQIVPNAIRL